MSLPAGWSLEELGGLGDWAGGGTPSKQDPRLWDGGTIPWVSPKDMKVFEIHDSEDHITKLAVSQSAAKRIPAGSVLFVTRSGILERTLPVAVTGVEVTMNQDLKALTPGRGIEPKCVAYAVRANEQNILRECGKDGTTVASIETERLKRFAIPIPPAPEQPRIVDALESHLTRIDAAIATLERVQRNLKRYRASVLKAAVEGRLVPTEAELARAEGRDYEPASNLLERVLTERRGRWEQSGRKGRFVEPTRPDTRELPELPDQWCWATVDQLCEVGTGATPHRGRAEYWDDGEVPWVTSAVVSRALVTEPSEFVTERALKETNLTLYPAGTLLVAMYGEGKTRGACTELGITATTNQALAALVTVGTASVVRPWLRLFLEAHYEALRGQALGGVQPNLNLSIVRAIAVPLPPAATRVRVLADCDSTLSRASESEKQCASQLAHLARLRQSILKWAFEGKLVDQDPNDEPASVLLERIKAERAAAAPVTKSRVKRPRVKVTR